MLYYGAICPTSPTMSDDRLIRLTNLKRECARRGLTAKDLSAAVGGRYTYWRDLLAGEKSFGEKIARKIEDRLGLARGSLDETTDAEDPVAHVIVGDASTTLIWAEPRTGGHVPPQYVRRAAPKPIPLDNNPDYPAIPRVQFKLAAGASGFSIDYLEDEAAPIVFRKDWYDSRGYDPRRLYALRVSGHSMEPGLWDGDTVVINTADTKLTDGDVFALNYEGELVIKRMVRDEGTWWMVSDNPDQRRYPRKRCHDDTFVLGRVVHKQSEHI